MPKRPLSIADNPNHLAIFTTKIRIVGSKIRAAIKGKGLIESSAVMEMFMWKRTD